MKISKEKFEKIVERELLGLPKEIRDRLENIEFFVEENPESPNILGFYHGIPYPCRKNPGYTLVMPDKIILFKSTIERDCRTERELEEKIRKVLLHEIGHYLGLSERELRKLSL